MKQLSVQAVNNGKNIHTSIEDNQDGTYIIGFTPHDIGKVILNVSAYGKSQFQWPIVVGGLPDPTKCEAYVHSATKVNQPVLIVIVAKDKSGARFLVGGATFNVGFAGEGELYNVALVDKMDGSYHLSVTPNKPGQYVIYVSLGEVDIAASPVNFVATG